MSGPRWRWFLTALVLCLHVIVVVSIARQPFGVNQTRQGKSLIFPLCHDCVHRIGPFADFFALYEGARQATHGRDPYFANATSERAPYHFPFRYLPGAAWTIGALFMWLPPRAAAITWLFVLEALLVAFLLLFRRRARAGWLRDWGSCALLLATPYFLELHMGQFTFATVAAAAVALLLTQSAARRELILAAVCLAAAILLKSFPLMLAPAFWREGRHGRRVLLWAVLAVAVINLPWFLLHPDWLQKFLAGNFDATSTASGLNAGNVGLPYLVFRTAAECGVRWTVESWHSFVQVWRVLILGGAVGLVLLARRKDLILSGSLLLLAHFASFPHVWEHHMSGVGVIALLVLLHLTEAGRSEPREPWTIVAAVTALVLLLLPTPFVLLDRGVDPNLWDPSPLWSAGGRLLMPSVKALPVLILLGLAARGLLRGQGVLTRRQVNRCFVVW